MTRIRRTKIRKPRVPSSPPPIPMFQDLLRVISGTHGGEVPSDPKENGTNANARSWMMRWSCVQTCVSYLRSPCQTEPNTLLRVLGCRLSTLQRAYAHLPINGKVIIGTSGGRDPEASVPCRRGMRLSYRDSQGADHRGLPATRPQTSSCTPFFMCPST